MARGPSAALPGESWITTGPRSVGWLVFTAVAAIVLAYQPVWHAGFVWDDDAHLTRNATIIGPLGFKAIWTSAEANYFPLVLTNFWVQHQLWGLAPLPYHLVNVAFHAVNALLLFVVLRRLRVTGAWLGAALWALHPVQVESVAWVCELKNTQSCFFFLLAIWFFLRWTEREGGPHLKSRDYGLALLCAAMAILSKPSTVMLPVALWLCWWWVKRGWHWRDVLWLAPFFLLSAAASGWTIWEQKVHSKASGAAWDQTGPERLVIAGRAIWFYLGKLVWPQGLSFIYRRWEIAATVAAFVPAILAGGALLALWRGRDGRLRSLFFAGAYFVALLFPVLGFFSIYFFRYSFVADHFQYLASIGPLVLAGAGAGWCFERAGQAALRRASAIIVGGVMINFAALSWHQAGTFRDVQTLWRHTLALNPECWLGHNNLSQALMQEGRFAEAMRHCELSLRLKPDDPEILTNLANAHLSLGQVPDAIKNYEAALRVNPGIPDAHNSFGYALTLANRLPEAVAHYEEALRLRPNFPAAHFNFGNTLYRLGRKEDAATQWQAAARADPSDATSLGNLGAVWLDLGRVAESLAASEASLRFRPDAVDVRCNLAIALAQSGRISEAIQQVDHALRLKPESTAAREHRARFEAMLAAPKP